MNEACLIALRFFAFSTHFLLNHRSNLVIIIQYNCDSIHNKVHEVSLKQRDADITIPESYIMGS